MAPRVIIGQSWTEARIAQTIGRGVFNNAVLMVPCCGWAGHECDLLVVERGLRIIDIEIKISRADLRADAKKDKWWVRRPWSKRATPAVKVDWPPKVWKHYYVMPTSIWDDKLVAEINDASGVILLTDHKQPQYRIIRMAKPNRKATPISSADAINIARLANLRMWAALVKEKP